MMKPERLKRDLRPALVFLSGELIAVPIPLEREEVILGRALEADVRVNDTKVSRRHAKINKVLNPETNEIEFVLTDFGSRNGMLVNGQRVSREILQNGDKITIGEHILRFDLLDEIDREYQRQIHRLISHDDLTGLLSSRSFFSELRREAARAKSEARPFCVLMMDVDHFKNVNDTHGHLTGSKTLEEIGASIIEIMRSGDAAARFGGEEFAAFLLDAEVPQAIVAAERIRSTIEAQEFSVVRTGKPVSKHHVTISIGISAFPQDSSDPIELVEMADAMPYPLPRSGQAQAAFAPRMSTERARDRHEPIADERTAQAAGLLRKRTRDRVARDAAGQRNGRACARATREAIAAVPVLVDQTRMPQVGDAGTAQLAEPRECGRVRACAKHRVETVAVSFQWRTRMRRAEENDAAHVLRPRVTQRIGVVQRAACDEAAHAVAEQHEFLDVDRPRAHERLELRGERAAIGRDVQAAVVVQVDRRVVRIAFERGAMVMAVAPPLQVTHAQAVREHDDACARSLDVAREGGAIEFERAAVAAQAHADAERIAGCREMVADHAVECRQQGFTRGRGPRLTRFRHPRQHAMHTATDTARHAADAAVNQTGDAARRLGDFRTEHGRQARDVVMQVLAEVGHADRRLDRELTPGAQVVTTHGQLSGHLRSGSVLRPGAASVRGERARASARNCEREGKEAQESNEYQRFRFHDFLRRARASLRPGCSFDVGNRRSA